MMTTDVPGKKLFGEGVLASVWTEYRAIVLITGTYGVTVPLFLWSRGLIRHYSAPDFSLSLIPIACVLVPLAVAFANRRASQWLAPGRVVAMLVVFTCLPIGFSSFVGFKRALVDLIPYRLDPALHAGDVWLHGGRAPWEWLAPILTPTVLRVIEFWYLLWYLVQAGFLYYFVWNPSAIGRQFLLTYLLNWIVLGNVCAALLFSVGPCYYLPLIGGPDPYAPLWPLLKEAVPTTIEIQRQLMHGGAMKTGIAAMPSLHVAHATLIAIVCWTVTRNVIVRTAGVSFVMIIQLGSVALGWHYSIDGYVAALATAALWCGVGRWIEWPPIRFASRPSVA